jgi:DNA topoisomerase-1
VGHVRDLDHSNLGIDIENNFKPTYVISKDKKKVVNDLKNCVKSCSEVILAADEDREGEAIAASLAEVLNLKNPKRIVFNEITKNALTNALKNPRQINYNLVKAQETRRFLDRIVGFKVSPVLWSNISAGNLSAGRVQSVVVKLIIEKENEIENLKQDAYYKITGKLHSQTDKSNKLDVTLYGLDKDKTSNKSIKGHILKLNKKEHVEKLLNILDKSTYVVKLIEDKTSKRNPSPPFITSSLQQEASRKFGFNIKSTMCIAQKLYENGHITYMRTDSINLSTEALNASRSEVEKLYGKDYLPEKPIAYKSKVKNAQEAHEAIRPAGAQFVHPDTLKDTLEKREYELYKSIYRHWI